VGLFPGTVWLEWITTAGFEPLAVPFEHSPYGDTGHEGFPGLRPVTEEGIQRCFRFTGNGDSFRESKW